MKIWRWVSWAVLLAIVSGAGVYALRHSVPKPEAPAPSAPREPNVLRFPPGSPQLSAIKVSVAEQAVLPLAEPLNGRIAYDENYTARVSSPIAGRVVSLNLVPGDEVRAGQPLLTLDSPDLATAMADLDKATADETRKRLAYERAKTLFDGGVLPRKDFEAGEADYGQARAETRRAQMRLRNLSPRNAKHASGAANGYVLRAPISGVLADRRVNPGMEVRPDLPEPLFTITDPTHLWVLIDLPERNLANVAPGNLANVEVDAYPDMKFTATIARVGEIVDPATRRIQVRCTIDNPDRKLKPEMYARVTLLAEDGARAVRVPNTALVSEGAQTFVFVETGPGVFERRQVTLKLQDRETSYVNEGLARGERVVTGGALLLSSELRESS